jgi:Mg2+ and Co2+ transporter CorA
MIQRDNQLNLSIAEHSRHLNKINTDIAKSSQQIAVESRRDNASMKTIAVLTLIFLPGTWVAVSSGLPLQQTIYLS